jgi:hypothetical protein
MDPIVYLSIGLRLLPVLIIIIGLIILLASQRHKKSHSPYSTYNKEWYLQLALSKEDAISQLFLLLSFLFLGSTLLLFNKEFGEPLSWRAILFITSIIGLAGAYYLKTIYTLTFSLIGLISWWIIQSAYWTAKNNIATSTIFAGLIFLMLLFYSLGRLHEKEIRFKRFSLIYLIFGIITTAAVLFFFSTKSGLVLFEEMTRGASFFGSWQLLSSLLILLVLLAGTTVYAFVQRLLYLFEFVAIFALTSLFGLMLLLPQQNLFISIENGRPYTLQLADLSGTGILWALFYNLVAFFYLLGLIFSGFIRRDTWLINLGTAFLFFSVIIKYFDWFFPFLSKSVFFIGAGILLLAVGWLMEKGRRYIISNIQGQDQQAT